MPYKHTHIFEYIIYDAFLLKNMVVRRIKGYMDAKKRSIRHAPLVKIKKDKKG